MSKIDEIKARVRSAKEIGLTGWNVATAVYNAYLEDVPALLNRLDERDAALEALRAEYTKLNQFETTQSAKLLARCGELEHKIERLEVKEGQHRQAVEDGRWVLLPEEIHCGDKVGDWLIASVDFGSKMERVEAFYLIRESYLDEYVESTCNKAEAALLKEGTE